PHHQPEVGQVPAAPGVRERLVQGVYGPFLADRLEVVDLAELGHAVASLPAPSALGRLSEIPKGPSGGGVSPVGARVPPPPPPAAPAGGGEGPRRGRGNAAPRGGHAGQRDDM